MFTKITRTKEEKEHIRRHKMYTERCAYARRRAPIKTGWAETDNGATREAQRAREVGRERIQDARKT